MATFTSFSSGISYKGKTPARAPASRNNTDVIAPNVKLFIEGVQVPFESISISQVYDQLPTATIQIPPASGLVDIIRGYEPKVHVFFEDVNTGGDRLLFWGHVKAGSYARSRARGNSYSYISFRCVHKNSLLNGFTLDYTGWANPTSPSQVDPASSSQGRGVKLGAVNSLQSLIKAMEGVNGVASPEEEISLAYAKNTINRPTDKVSSELELIVNRIYGMPGVSYNFWNQVKASALQDPNMNLAMVNMWIPLVEQGIGYFKRMSGHPVLENILQDSKQPYCHRGTTDEAAILVPPSFRNSMSSAVQQEMAVAALQNQFSWSSELTTFADIIHTFYTTSLYDVMTLSSPAEVPADELISMEDTSPGGINLIAVETILKPQLPSYYSPTCNVILPRMWHTCSFDQEESSLPTRISITHDAIPGSSGASGFGVVYRGPSSIREAIAYNVKLLGGSEVTLDLANTRSYSYSIPGKYEQGVGIRPEQIMMPWWLSVIVGAKSDGGTTGQQEVTPQKGSAEYTNLMLQSVDWNIRYGSDVLMNDATVTKTLNPLKSGLNPYSPTNTSIKPYERLLFATVDYEYSKRVRGSRTGTVDGVFNPYVIPGYPIDVIDDSPNHPSFHGFCTSVTHSITARSISTTLGIMNVTTYAELSNYYSTPVPPFLASCLDMINGDEDTAKRDSGSYGDSSAYSNVASTLIQNPKAKATANTFYLQVLGVGAAAPDDLIHFPTGRAYPLERKDGILIPKISPGESAPPNLFHKPSTTGREPDDFFSTVGNLRLVARNIESKASIESKFSLSFIPLDKDLYNTTQVNYVNPILASDFFLEPGASMFLDYMETSDFLKPVG